MPLNGYAQDDSIFDYLFGGAFKVDKEEEDKAKRLGYYYSYENDEYSKQGHRYRSAKKFKTFINKDGKVFGDYPVCELEVISGKTLNDETLRISFYTYSDGYPEGKDFDNYAKGIIKSYGTGSGLGEKSGLTLTMDMGGYVDGRAKIEETFTFPNSSVTSEPQRVFIDIPFANVNVSGGVKRRIAKIRKSLSTKPLFK